METDIYAAFGAARGSGHPSHCVGMESRCRQNQKPRLALEFCFGGYCLVFVWRIKNICCPFSFSRGVYGALVVLTFLKRSPAKEVGEAGEKTPIFPAGKVAIWIAQQDKFMAALRWFLPRENSCIINRKVKFEIFAIP